MIDTANLTNLVIAKIDMSQVMQMFQASHRAQFHMCQAHAFNTQFPINRIQCLALHYLAILFQHIIADRVSAVLLQLELEKFSTRHVIQPNKIG
jgi:hypothetical protein